MVEIERTESRTVGIDDIPDIPTLRANVESIFGNCKSSITGPVILEDIIIFGSVSRGVASMGESDLDILLVLSNPDGSELDQRFDLDEIIIRQCMENSGGLVLQRMTDIFGGIDIETVKEINMYNRLERIVTPRPSDTRGGSPRVYSIKENRFINEDEIKENSGNRR